VSKFSGQYRFLTTYSDEEQKFMYKINQGRLIVFCIVSFWLGGPPSPVRIIAKVPWFVYQNWLEPSGGIYHLHKRNWLLWLHVNNFFVPKFPNCQTNLSKAQNLFMSSFTLFWDDITKFWNENLLLFTFLTGKLRKNLFGTNKKFVYLNVMTNFRPITTSENIVSTTWKGL
jgi:hypothetical protein